MFNFKINRMNKKFLSTLLMGALFIASVSVFTSCKDYDEDIQNLQTQVDGLKSDLNSQIATLKAAQEKCASDCAAAQAALDQAIKNLESTKANKADVDKAIEDAIKGAKADNDALKTELQKYAADYADAAAAKAAAAAKEEAIKEAVAQAKALVDALDAKKVDLVEFTAKVQELQNSIKAVDDALAAYKTEQTAAWAANDEALKEINLQIDALKKFNEQVQKDFEGVNTNIENLQKDLKKVKEDLEAQKKDLEGQLKAAKDELQKQIDELAKSETIVGLTNRIVALEEKAENNRVEITKIQGWMTEADKKFTDALAGAEKANVLDLYIQKVLTSIYLKPEFFYSGIEAIELPALYDNQYTAADPLVIERKDGKVTKMEVWTKRADLAMVDVCNGGIAYYHLNPWNADIEGATVAFLSNEAKTRAGANYGVNDLIKPVKETLTKDSWDKAFAGVLPVEFTGSFEAVNSLLKAGILPQVALNYKQTVDGKDVNVSSDWALLAPTQYCKLLIADKTGIYTPVEHEGFNFDQAVEKEIESLGLIKFKENGQEESRVNPTTGHFTRLLENITADSIPGTYKLRYDSVFNLNELVETHYTYSYRNAAGVEVTKADQLMSEDMFKKFGLHYEFDIVKYNSGNNETDESAHIWVVKPEKADGDYTAYFTKVNADGTRTEAKEGDFAYEQAGRASVGRMPVVRVVIKDATGKVVAYSYIKFEITEDFPEDPEIIKHEDFEFKDPFYVDCDDKGYEGILTWSQVERQILIDALSDNYSKNSFEEKWTLVGYRTNILNVLNGTEGEATQFDETGAELKEKIGKVQLVEDPKGQHMQVLQWSFTHADIEKYFYKKDPQTNEVTGLKNVDANGESTIDFTVYVKLDGPITIWLKFYIPKGTFKFATGSIDDNKTDAMWKGLNTRTEGFKEVYANVVAPNTKSDDVKDFVLDMLDTFDGHKVVANLDNIKKNFPEFAKLAEDNYEFTFTTPTKASPIANAEFNADENGQWTVDGNSGAVYTLKVSKDTKAVLVAAIKDAPKGAEVGDTIVAIENVKDIVYKRNISAYDVLNHAGHNEVKSGKTFTAYLKISVFGCYPMIISDGSDYFNVKFLRPVDVEKTKDAVMEDAVDGGSKVNIMDLVSLIDWRDQSFTSPNGLTDNDGDQPDVQYKKYDTPHYINYYGVKIFADVNKALTDISKPEAERQNILPADEINETNLVNLKKNSPNAIFTFTPAKDNKITWDGKKFVGGELYYSNNNMNVKLFHIYVPIMLEYAWSEGLPIYCGYGVVTVKKTINNDAKKF